MGRAWLLRWLGTGRPRAAQRRNSRPGWRLPRLRSACSATRRPQRTGSGPSICARQTGAAVPARTEVPRLYVRAIDALHLSGDGVRAGAVAEEALRQFADYPDTATAAVVHHRAALFRAIETPAAGLLLMARNPCGSSGSRRRRPTAQKRGLTMAQRSCSTLKGSWQLALPLLTRRWRSQKRRALRRRSRTCCRGCQISRSFAGGSGRGSPYSSGDGHWPRPRGNGAALVWLAVCESNALMKMGKFQNASDVALRGLAAARQTGLQALIWLPSWPPMPLRRYSHAGERPTQQR